MLHEMLKRTTKRNLSPARYFKCQLLSQCSHHFLVMFCQCPFIHLIRMYWTSILTSQLTLDFSHVTKASNLSVLKVSARRCFCHIFLLFNWFPPACRPSQGGCHKQDLSDQQDHRGVCHLPRTTSGSDNPGQADVWSGEQVQTFHRWSAQSVCHTSL